MEQKKNCLICGKEFIKNKSESVKYFSTKRFCSQACGAKGKDHSHLSKYSFKKGVRSNPNGEFKKGLIPHNFKKEGYGYSAVHYWIYNHYKKTGWCHKCGKYNNHNPHKKWKLGPTQWANISGEYKRDITDYIEVCYSCHSKMDKKNPHHPSYTQTCKPVI